MSKLVDLTGQKFGKWTVIRKDDKLFIPPTRKPRQKKDKILVGEE